MRGRSYGDVEQRHHRVQEEGAKYRQRDGWPERQHEAEDERDDDADRHERQQRRENRPPQRPEVSARVVIFGERAVPKINLRDRPLNENIKCAFNLLRHLP